MHIGGEPALEAVRRSATRVIRTPAFGVVASSPPSSSPVPSAPAPTPAAPAPRLRGHAVGGRRPFAHRSVRPRRSSRPQDADAVPRRRAANCPAPPPAVVVNSPGTLRIPSMALSAYRNAEQMMAAAVPGLRRQLEPARRDRTHRVDARQRRRHRCPRHRGAAHLRARRWTARCRATRSSCRASRPAGSPTPARWARCSSCPGTWARYASDGDGDGKADVQNLFDATPGGRPLPVQRRA